MAKHLKMTKSAHGSPTGADGEGLHYKQGDIHEVGSPTMPEQLANQFLSDGYAEEYDLEGALDNDTVNQVGEFGGPTAAGSPQQPNEGEVPPAAIKGPQQEQQRKDAESGKGKHGGHESSKSGGKSGKQSEHDARHTGASSHGDSHSGSGTLGKGAQETSGVSGTGSTSGTTGGPSGTGGTATGPTTAAGYGHERGAHPGYGSPPTGEPQEPSGSKE